MQPSLKETLLKILTAIDYADNKEAFADKFIGIVLLQAITHLKETAPADIQEKLKSEFNAADTPEKLLIVAKNNFSEGQLKNAFDNAVKSLVKQWMEEVASTLNDSQRQKLKVLAQELP